MGLPAQLNHKICENNDCISFMSLKTPNSVYFLPSRNLISDMLMGVLRIIEETLRVEFTEMEMEMAQKYEKKMFNLAY